MNTLFKIYCLIKFKWEIERNIKTSLKKFKKKVTKLPLK